MSILFFMSLQMVGIGTSDVNLDKFRHTFCSLLGKDTDSWGLSYTGENNTTCCDVAFTALMDCCINQWVFSSLRLVASQRREDKLLLPVRTGVDHWSPSGHVARHTHFLQKPQMHRLVTTHDVIKQSLYEWLSLSVFLWRQTM